MKVFKMKSRKKGDLFLKIKIKAERREDAERLMEEIRMAIIRNNRHSEKKIGYSIKLKFNN